MRILSCILFLHIPNNNNKVQIYFIFLNVTYFPYNLLYIINVCKRKTHCSKNYILSSFCVSLIKYAKQKKIADELPHSLAYNIFFITMRPINFAAGHRCIYSKLQARIFLPLWCQAINYSRN